MDLTGAIKAELAQVVPTRREQRLAQLVALVRFSAAADFDVHAAELKLEVTSGPAVDCLVRDASELLPLTPAVRRSPGATSSEGATVTMDNQAGDTVRRLGLVTRNGYPVIGLPPAIIRGGAATAEAALRGALLAGGVGADPERSSMVEIVSPGPEAALAVLGCLRRIGLKGKTRDVRGVHRASLRDGDAVAALLARLGAHRTRLEWNVARLTREENETKNRLANFDDANLRRSADAATKAAAEVERAFEILGDDIPENLVEAGRLRMAHQDASLEELGRMAEPPLSKDAIAGRIRRLIKRANRRAAELDIPPASATR